MHPVRIASNTSFLFIVEVVKVAIVNIGEPLFFPCRFL